MLNLKKGMFEGACIAMCPMIKMHGKKSNCKKLFLLDSSHYEECSTKMQDLLDLEIRKS